VVGGATPVLSRPRAIGLAAVGAALLAYSAVSELLWEFSTGADVAVVGLVILPASLAAIWIALPVARLRSVLLLHASALAGVVLIAFLFAGLPAASNVAKLACFALVGFWFLSLFEQPWWVALVACLVPWVDVWSVAAGPSNYVLEEKPGVFDRVAVDFPTTGEGADINIGPPDIIFFALFLAAAARFGLRVGWTWACMTAFLTITLVLAWQWETLGLPALPAVSLGFLLPNADLVWSSVRSAWHDRAEARSSAK
jgi:hypothetical protein